jgi:ferredoxin-NADP reductase
MMKLRMKAKTSSNRYRAKLLSRHWLTDRVFELGLSRPESFEFQPGQRIRLIHKAVEREYSLITTPTDQTLALCVFDVPGGQLSPLLASAEIGTGFSITGPDGYFIFRPSTRPPIFVATGTGIAPFLSMARSGVTGFTLLHGVQRSKDLYYENSFRATARMYIPCLSQEQNQLRSTPDCFCGRVTEYLAEHLPVESYDFYLCGRQEMTRDVTLLADERFPGSLVYTETFY